MTETTKVGEDAKTKAEQNEIPQEEHSETSDENAQKVESAEAREESSEKAGAAEKSPEEEALHWKSKAAYLAAEIENMSKRFQREKSDLVRFANEGLLQKVVPVVDNLVLALKAGRNTDSDQGSNEKLLKQMMEGVEMTLKHFEDTLSQLGVEFIESVGQEFDPNLHEAVGQSQDNEKKDNTIIEEFQRGFKLNGRLVRAAKVVVNKI